MAEAATPLVPDVPTIARSRAGSNDVLDRLWRLLSSVRFAILLISVISLGVLAGTLVMQAPADVAASQTSFDAWLARPRAKYGEPWASIFGALDLYRVFSSLWFRSLLAVLTLSVVVCTVNRMPGITASVRRPVVRAPARLFERAPLRAEFEYGVSSRSGGAAVADGSAGTAGRITAEQAQLQAAKVLGARRFRTIHWEDGEARAVFADKNRFGKYGTFLNHIGIVAILGAAVLGSAFGWREDGFMVPEGSTREVGRGTGLAVRNDGFVDEYYPTGGAKDYRSDLVLLREGQEVARKTIRVNDPLEYAGVRFHQAFFGPAAVMRATDQNGAVVYDDGVALGYEFTGGGLSRNGGFFTLGSRNGLPTLAVYVLVPSNQLREPDPDIPAGSVRLELFEPRQARPTVIETLPQGQPKDILGYTFEFVRERQFSGIQVAYNPAVAWIWVACALMVLGTMAVFYFPLRRIWVRAEPAGDGGVRLRVAAVANRDVLFAREFEQLALDIDKEIGGLARTLGAPHRTEETAAPAAAAPAAAAPAAAAVAGGPSRPGAGNRP
jgi:cytochrome c biogenesis protein